MPKAPIDLRCEYFTDPLGLDVAAPRLSWRLDDDRRGARQTAYRIVATDADAAISNSPLWDSGKVESDQSTQVEYAGRALRARERIRWRVRVWDAEGVESPWSAPAQIEMGLLDRADWTAKWIGSDVVGGPRTIPPCPYLRKRFTATAKPVRARLYITALGLFEPEINGTRVGEDVFAPGRTDYNHRVPYHVYDVTDLLVEGENAIGVILGDGWYAGHMHSDPRMYHGDRPRLLAQLELTFEDGSTQTIATDETWRQTAGGPIRSSDIMQGEDYDARMELPGWSTAGYDDAAWRPVQTFDVPAKMAIVARRMPPVRRIQELRPAVAPWPTPNKRRWTFDFGQNMVGRVRLRLRNTRPGQIITIRHAEMLDENGKLYTDALRSARATDYYTCRGAELETYEPRFTFHGFRYIEVNGLKFGQPPEADVVTGVVLHTDLESTGTFECSHPLINQLQSNIRWSQKGNFLEIPTDCPQRDERLGWTGDAQVFIRTAAFNMNVAGFFTKWLQDVTDAQFENGGIPSTVPFCVSIPNEGGPAWSDAAVICPWTIYQCYGDTRVLSDRYETMRRFVQYLKETSKNLIRADESQKWRGYGDWLSLNADTPRDLIGTAFFAHVSDLMAKIAGVLGKTEDVTRFESLRDDVKAAWRKRYVTPEGLIVGQTQTAFILALHFELIEPAMRPRVFEQLVRDIEGRGNHLSTGFVGTPYLTQVLADGGRLDVAYKLLEQQTFPGWLFPVTHGATTMWERWDGWTPDKGFNDAGMNSYNHYAYGAIGAWMYATVAGLDLDPDRPGYKHIVIRPRPGGSMTRASASLDSMYGPIESAWTLSDGTFRLEATIPPNTTATIHVPAKDAASVREGDAAASESQALQSLGHRDGAAIFEAPAGRYTFTNQLT